MAQEWGWLYHIFREELLMKKRWTSFLVMGLILILALSTGCSKAAPNAGSSDSAAKPADQSKPADQGKSQAKITLKFATTVEDAGIDHAITQEFKKRLGELSGGTMDVNLFMSGQMGDEKQALELLKLGELDLGYNAIQGDLYYKDLNAVAVPFVFPNIEATERFMAGPTGDKIKEALLQKGGVRYLGMFDLGPRYFTSNKPFKNVDEMKKLKIRLPQIQSWIEVFKQIGAAPTPIAATEIVTALKTGTVNGQENFLNNIYARQMWEYQKYLVATDHVRLPQTWLVSDKTWQKLNDQQKKWLQQSVTDAIAYVRPQVDQMNADFLKKLQDKGMVLIQPDRDSFVKAAGPALEKILKKDMAPGVYESAMKAIKGQ